MILKNGNIYDLFRSAEDKKLVCFGAGFYLGWMCEVFETVGFWEKIDLIADNSEDKQGTYFEYNGKKKLISSPGDICSIPGDRLVIIITTMRFPEILEQLEGYPGLKYARCYLYTLLAAHPLHYEFPRRDGEQPLIPKTIHYFWFGEKPLPDKYKQYMETWRKYCPDYEIVEWNESNYDIKKNKYMYQAYQSKKLGFVPDYARLDVIYRYGGIYLDTDVELIRSLDDLLCDEAFCGMHIAGTIATGLGFGAVKGFPIIREWRDAYDGLSFINDDGSLNQVTCTKYQSEVMIKYGLRSVNRPQLINGMMIHATDVLSPMDAQNLQLHITENTHAIHHYDGTWQDSDVRNSKARFAAQVEGFVKLANKGDKA